MFQKKCATCNIYVPQARTCQIMIPAMQGKIGPEDYCSQHNDHILFCEVCGAGLIEPLIEVKPDKTVHVYCGNCINQPRQ